MARHAPPGPRQQALALLALIALLGALLGLTVLLTQVLGAEPGQPCVQGAFACRNAVFNDARCLMTGPDRGLCTHLCEQDVDCGPGQVCAEARWTDSGGSGGRTERVCQVQGAGAGGAARDRSSAR